MTQISSEIQVPKASPNFWGKNREILAYSWFRALRKQVLQQLVPFLSI